MHRQGTSMSKFLFCTGSEVEAYLYLTRLTSRVKIQSTKWLAAIAVLSIVAYDLVHKMIYIPNTLQKLNFLQHNIHIECSSVWQLLLAHTSSSVCCWVLCNSRHISLPAPPLLPWISGEKRIPRSFSILPLRAQLLRQIWDSIRWITHSRGCEKILCRTLSITQPAAADETFVTCARRADRWSVGRTAERGLIMP